MTPPVQSERLLKLLLMTTSESDGEALNAIRAANALMKRMGLDWYKVMGIGIAKEPPAFAASRPQTRTYTETPKPQPNPTPKGFALSPNQYARMQSIISTVCQHISILNPTERAFMHEMADRFGRFQRQTLVSPRQWDYLESLMTKAQKG